MRGVSLISTGLNNQSVEAQPLREELSSLTPAVLQENLKTYTLFLMSNFIQMMSLTNRPRTTVERRLAFEQQLRTQYKKMGWDHALVEQVVRAASDATTFLPTQKVD